MPLRRQKRAKLSSSISICRLTAGLLSPSDRCCPVRSIVRQIGPRSPGRVAIHARSYVPAHVVRDAEPMAARREAQAAQRRLKGDEPELPAIDLASEAHDRRHGWTFPASPVRTAESGDEGPH